MKVTDVKIHVVSVPFTEPETWRFGRLWGLTSAIVEVETDEGITGLGETNGSPYIKVVVEALKANAEWLKGEDPRQIRRFIRDSADRGWHHYPYVGHMALAAIEMALWDIVGKACDAPVHQLFGGHVRTEAPYYWYLTVPDRDPETARKQAADAVKLGFKTIYIKLGFEIDADVTLTSAVRDEVGDAIAIRVDANEGWTVFEAVRALAALEPLNLELVEEPIDMHNLEGIAYLRRKTRLPIAANQSAWFAYNVKDLIAHEVADVIVTDPHQLGSMLVFRDVAAMCEIAGIPVIKHAFADMGITTAAGLHVAATLPGPELAHQQFLQILEHDLLKQPFEFKGGMLEVPMGPGLGVEINRDALAHYAELYERYGEYEGYSPGFNPSPVPEDMLRPRRVPASA